MGSTGGRNPILRVVGLVFGLGMLALMAMSLFGSSNDESVLIPSGSVVTPARGRNVVYLEKAQSQIRCTATTSDGKAQALAPFSGSDPDKRFGGKRRHFRLLGSRGKDYRAVGELPLDSGPVTLRCPGANRIWVSAPDTWSWPIVVFAVGVAGCAVVLFVVRWRRRGGPTNAGPDQNPPMAPQQGYPGYPPPGYPAQGYPNQGYPNQGYPQPGYPTPGYPGAPPPGYPNPGYPPNSNYPPNPYYPG
ncbi:MULTISPECIES: hypothetical protein [unclassified Mycolicibacterium]|uniref:hypothetical protein n=1 Tax=unclassified Mycolicibacterium TaxID=2636767 RepID=UPI001EE3BE90|nr:MULTISPECIES: hypothetical protein [unclassified Mycolicibacterium]